MRFSIHVGPCAVKQLSEKMRAQGLQVALEGTEHVYLDIAGETWEDAIAGVMPALKAAYPGVTHSDIKKTFHRSF